MIIGTITLKSGDVIEINDGALVANCLSISSATCGSDFDIGTFNASEMKLRIYDDDSLDHEFDGAVIELTYSQNAGGTEATDTTEAADTGNIPLGIYIVDGDKTERFKNTVKLTAYDKALLFDKELPDDIRSKQYTPLETLTLACEATGIVLGVETLDGFPNSGISFGVNSKSLQTYRDLVMWTAQLMCCNAMMSRTGERTLSSSKYSSADGVIEADYTISGNERVNITFSDTRTHIKHLSAYSGGKVKNYTTGLTPSDEQVRAGTYNAFKNPLLDSLDEASCDNVNIEWLKFVDNFATRRIKAKLFDRPEIIPGDTLKFTGGYIDIRRKIIGVVTSVNWKYRAGTTIICAAPATAKEGG